MSGEIRELAEKTMKIIVPKKSKSKSTDYIDKKNIALT